jgi:glycosyltransferase involved in cell wall biosynthesis
MTAPRFSIITPSFNRADLITTAIESVRAQDVPEVEHWIIDGVSTDETLAVLARYPEVKVLSEPDLGIYDAVNKGLDRARGEIVGILNTDDHYTANIFGKVASAFEDPAVAAVYGGCEIYEERPAGNTVIRRFSTDREIDLSLENVTVGVGTINARFWRRSFLDKLGRFDLRYPIASDRDLLIRAALAKPRAVLLNHIVYFYRLHPGSLTFHHGEPRYREDHLAICDDYLARRDLDPEMHRWVRRLHTKETIQTSVAAAYRGDVREVVRSAARGCSRDAAWPLSFVKETLIAIQRRVGFGKGAAT